MRGFESNHHLAKLGNHPMSPAHRAGGVLNLAWAEDVHDTARDFYEERNAAGCRS